MDGYALPFDSAPIIKQGVTMVPFRAIAEALGVSVVWNQTAKTITASGLSGDGQPVQLKLTVGQKTAAVDGTNIELLEAPVNQQGHVLIPLRVFADQFGAKTGWNQTAHTVSIESPQREMRLLGFYAISSYDQLDRTNSLNAVAFGWSEINENSQFTTGGKVYKWPQPAGDVTPQSIVKDVNDSNKDTYLMVSGVDGSRQLTKVMTDPQLRSSSIGEMIEVASERGFGGIMLDYEGLGLKDDPAVAKKQLNEYVKELDEKAAPLGLKLSLAIHAPNSSYKGYDYGTLAKYADEIVLMAYDYTADKKSQPLALIDEAIQQTLQAGVSKEQLLLGVNMDSEDETSIASKLGLAKRYGLSGVAFWRLGIFTDAELQAIDASVTPSS
nr:stalk domain-containing protein [Cohnella lubricantis]